MLSKTLYVYPQWHTVSFTLVAKKHIEYMRRLGADIVEIDEKVFPSFTPVIQYTTIIHPAIYILSRVYDSRRGVLSERPREALKRYVYQWKKNFREFVCIDVADSDRISSEAVDYLDTCDKIIVPSNASREAYISSGVRRRVFVVPHGLDPEWYDTPNIFSSPPQKPINPSILLLTYLKYEHRKKLLLFWLWHSHERKGWDEVKEIYRRVRREREDVVLVLKTAFQRSQQAMEVSDLGVVEIYGWLDEYSKMALYDISDIVLTPSRGGGFELNTLEALARGVPVIAVDNGCFRDYVPDYLRAKKGERVKVLPGNSIHVGYGYKVDVEDATRKVLDILDKYDEYKAKVDEYRRKILRNRYRWDIVAKELINVLGK
ncbi:MAG: hypothetical protein C0179_02810 [Fervidicoccus sp.]|nr:MAG: hypothetical protein C0179_02810 [Fervidicoccus sp.]